MIDPAMDWGGLKDSENAPNSFFPKINQTLFWRFGTDMFVSEHTRTNESFGFRLRLRFRLGTWTGYKKVGKERWERLGNIYFLQQT